MPTTIVFSSNRGDKPLIVSVAQDPEQLADSVANGATVLELTQRPGEKPVWINVANVAYWHEQRSPAAMPRADFL